jgi:hypothetical protein
MSFAAPRIAVLVGLSTKGVRTVSAAPPVARATSGLSAGAPPMRRE